MDASYCNTTDSVTGVIMDVSGSMRINFEGRVDSNDNWLRSTFDAVDRLLENDEISEDNKIFVIGVGVNPELGKDTFDLLSTLGKCKVPENTTSNLSHIDTIIEGVEILKKNGAPYVDIWAPVNKMMEVFSFTEAKTILHWFHTDQELVKQVATEILPTPCRSRVATGARQSAINVANALPFVDANNFIDNRATASEEDIFKVKTAIFQEQIANVKAFSVKSLRDAAIILRGAVGIQPNQYLSQERIKEIMDGIEPFVYGLTPLMKALDQVKKIFSIPRYKKLRKFLIVLSDGDPTDGDGCNAPTIQLEELGVKTICCYITQNDINNPKQLFSTKRDYWSKPAQFMFRLSSEVKTELLPRTIFIKRGWKVETTNNITKLFAQVNHPALLDEITDFFRSILTSQDALADVLSSVSLDLYINQTKQDFEAPLQIGGTCYANAAATVLHLAMHRIVGRDGGYPKFDDLKNEMIEIYGNEGANTKDVLKRICPLYRLHVSEVNLKGALCAVAAKRLVVVTFQLTGKQWDSFSMFFHRNPRGVLTEEELTKHYNVQNPSGPGGHAVVLTSYSIKSLVFMNSWGCDWGDKGFFRVANSKVLNCNFYDVYWTPEDLSAAEKEQHFRFAQAIASKLIDHFQSLQTASIICPKCNHNSRVLDFNGTFDNVKCPTCKDVFHISHLDEENARARISIALYLTLLENDK